MKLSVSVPPLLVPTLALALGLLPAGSPAGATASGGGDASAVETRWSELVARHVVDDRWVDYEAWHASEEDRAALDAVVDDLAALRPSAMDDAGAIATWINLYNAVTVQLVLEHYPLASIKDIDTGLFGSPWKIERVTVEGRRLTLDQIEHEILRVDFDEPRIHFALNCASVGCPPLADEAFTGERLDAQLDEVTARALRDPTWLDLDGCEGAYGEGVIRLTKIFDWFTGDFGGEDGVRDFLARHRPDARFVVQNTGCALDYMDYDWSLNAPPDSRP